MKYKSFQKIFFEAPGDFEAYYREMYNSSSTIRFDIQINKQPAFLILNSELLSYVEDIYALNLKIVKKIKANRNFPRHALRWLISYSLIEEIKITNEIEGISSTRKQLKEVLNIKNPDKYVRFYGMVNKYRKLLNNDIVKVVDNQTLRELYNEVLIMDIQNEDPNDVPDGLIYRKEEVEVSKGGKTIHKGLMPEKNIIDTMEKALKILNDSSLSLLIRVAIFHYLFGYIHPFYEGNGRMSRFISSSYLCENLDVISALQVSISCKKNQQLYYESFRVTNDVRNKGDLTYFVIAFLEIFKKGLSSLIETIDEKTDQYNFYSTRIKSRYTNPKIQKFLDILLQATLFDFEGMTINEIADASQISYGTVRNYLKIKDLLKVIHEEKTDKPYRYSIKIECLD